MAEGAIVQVRLGVDSESGLVDRTRPMFVWATEDNHRPGMYDPDPAVLKQLGELEAGGRFMAEWDGGRWKIGRRLLD